MRSLAGVGALVGVLAFALPQATAGDLPRVAVADEARPAPKTVEAVFAEDQTNQYVLDIEAAMARAQAAHGAIPQAAAEAITRKADIRFAPAAEIDKEREVVQHRMVALLNVWRRAIDSDARQYVHYGATTVDVYDTALALQLQRSTTAHHRGLASHRDDPDQGGARVPGRDHAWTHARPARVADHLRQEDQHMDRREPAQYRAPQAAAR